MAEVPDAPNWTFEMIVPKSRPGNGDHLQELYGINAPPRS